jgi:hypothetical protein
VCALAACDGGGVGIRDPDAFDPIDDNPYPFVATGTRNGTPFEVANACSARLDSNDGTLEGYDAIDELGFQVRWARGAVAGTYPNDNADPEVLVLVSHIVNGNDINEGTQQGSVTFDTLGNAIGAEAAGHFDNVVLTGGDFEIVASGTFRCQLN